MPSGQTSMPRSPPEIRFESDAKVANCMEHPFVNLVEAPVLCNGQRMAIARWGSLARAQMTIQSRLYPAGSLELSAHVGQCGCRTGQRKLTLRSRSEAAPGL